MAKEESKKTYIVVHPKLNLMVAKFDSESKQLGSKLERVPVGTEIDLSEKAAQGLLAKGKISEKGKAPKAQVEEDTATKDDSKSQKAG